MGMMNMPRTYSSRDIAELVGADPSSVNRWIDSGKIKAFRTPGGHRRVLTRDLEEFLVRSGMPVPDAIRSQVRSVLLVDDDEMFLKSVKRALQKSNPRLEVDTCTSGVDALLKIGAKRPDIVVLDVYLPGLDGVEVCQKIKADPEMGGVMVIGITGRPSTKLEERMSEVGAAALLVKPVKTAALLKIIEGAAQEALRA